MKAKSIEVIPENCTGCQLCVMACSFHHEKECSVTKSCIKILSDGEWAFDFPLLCLQCEEATCVESCPNEVLYKDEATGAVLVHTEDCVGCGICIEACPFHALALDEEKAVIFKCDLCGGDPECVKWCSKGALIYKEISL